MTQVFLPNGTVLSNPNDAIQHTAQELTTSKQHGGVAGDYNEEEQVIANGYEEWRALGGIGTYKDYAKQVAQTIGHPDYLTSGLLANPEPEGLEDKTIRDVNAVNHGEAMGEVNVSQGAPVLEVAKRGWGV